MDQLAKRLSHYVFDDQHAKALNAYLKQFDFDVPTPVVGYRILEDYGGSDVIDYMLNFDIVLTEQHIQQQVLDPIREAIRKWSEQHFPNYSPNFRLQTPKR